MLKSNHHKRVNPAAAPKSGVITIEPLPTTLPVTIALGPIYFSLSNNVTGTLLTFKRANHFYCGKSLVSSLGKVNGFSLESSALRISVVSPIAAPYCFIIERVSSL